MRRLPAALSWSLRTASRASLLQPRRLLCTPTLPPLARLMASVQQAEAEGAHSATIEPCWMQGQATFGGLTAALCLEGARRRIPEGSDPLPLRSASINFIGITGSRVTIDTSVLRLGKASAFVSSSLLAVDGSGGTQVATTGKHAIARTQSALSRPWNTERALTRP